MESSKISKAELIRQYRRAIQGKHINLKVKLENPFFSVINNIYKRKPNNVVIDVTDTPTLTFKIIFSDRAQYFLEYNPNSNPNTLLTKLNDEDVENYDEEVLVSEYDDVIEGSLSEILNHLNGVKI